MEDTEVRKLSARGKHDRILLCRKGLGCEAWPSTRWWRRTC